MTLRICCLLEEQEMGLHSHAVAVAAFTPTNVTSCVTCVSSVVLVQDLLVIGAVRNSNTDITYVTTSVHTCTFSCHKIPFSGAR